MANSRLKYGDTFFEFERKMNVFRSVDSQLRNDFTSLNGTKEFLNYHTARRLSIGRELSKPGEVSGLRSFWEYAKDGAAFSFERDPELGLYLNFDGAVYSNDAIDYTYSGGENYYKTGAVNQILASETNIQMSQSDGLNPRFVSATSGDRFNKGLFIEGKSTNKCLYSQEFTNAAWTKSGATVSNFGADVTAPDGTYTADLVETPGTVYQDCGTLSGNRVVASCYFYGIDPGDTVTIRIKSSLGTLNSQFAYSDPCFGWQYIYASYAGTLGTNVTIELEFTGTTLIWGAQVEELLSPTSYIPTTSATASRSNEYIEFPLSSDYFDQETSRVHAFSFWMHPLYNSNNNDDNVIFQILNADVSDIYPFLQFKNLGTNFVTTGYNYDQSSASLSVTKASTPSNAMAHYFVYVGHGESSGDRFVSIYKNGTLVVSSGTFSDYAPIHLPNTLVIGDKYGDDTAPMVLTEFCYWKGKTFTSTEIQELADAEYQLGYGANRYENLTLVNTDFIDECKPGTVLKSFELEFEKV